MSLAQSQAITVWRAVGKDIACGGLGAIHLMAGKIGMVEAIDGRLQLLKVHLLERGKNLSEAQ